jgi:hypothetical protein
MTGRERILAAFRGEAPDAVPFSPNIYQWFYQHRAWGTLPEELNGATHPFEALRALGADILARWDTAAATRAVTPGIAITEESTGSPGACPHEVVTSFNRYLPGCDRLRRVIGTAQGALTEAWTYSAEARADFQTEFAWKSWDDNGAVRALLEAREYEFDPGEFRRWVTEVGHDGVVMASMTQSPLKTFHWLAGPENTSFFITDHPDEMRELAAIHAAAALRLLERVAAQPEVEILISNDNMDSLFYPPRYFRDYCAPFFSEAARIVHRHGKVLVVHACGRNRLLLPLVAEAGVDCLEGITPAPLGDVDLARAREMARRPGFTVNGGIDALHLELQ